MSLKVGELNSNLPQGAADNIAEAWTNHKFDMNAGWCSRS